MKIKFIFAVPIISILLYLIIASSSCHNENPVSPSGNFTVDTVDFFKWKIDSFSYSIQGFIPFDTNDIYIIFSQLPYLVHYDGLQYRNIDLRDPYFRPISLKAKDKNTIYIGGLFFANGNNHAVLKILKSNNIETYIAPDDSTIAFGHIIINEGNSLWISTMNEIFYKFESDNFTRFNLEKKMHRLKFYKNNDDIVYIYCQNNQNVNPNEPLKYYIKKIVNDTIINISEEILETNFIKYVDWNYLCLNNDFIMSSLHSFFWFKNEKWAEIYHSSSLEFNSLIGGFSMNNLIATQYDNGISQFYNGLIYTNNQVFVERNLTFASSETPLCIIPLNENIIYISTESVFTSRLLRGIRKNY
jgi:hypothetical protein